MVDGLADLKARILTTLDGNVSLLHDKENRIFVDFKVKSALGGMPFHINAGADGANVGRRYFRNPSDLVQKIHSESGRLG